MKAAIMRTFALALLALPAGAAYGQDDPPGGGLSRFEGMWQVSPRGPGPGRGPIGARERRGPPPGAGGFAGRLPVGGPGGPPDGAGDDLPGPAIEGLDTGDRRTYAIMTPAGKAAFEALDPRQLPANNCMTNGLPSLVGIPDLQEWRVEGDRLTIHYADFNTYRTIWLDGRAAPAQHSHLGHSTGTWDGDDFVVTTTNLTAIGGGLGRNAPGSASRSYVERYHIASDGSVTGTVTVTDPEYLTQAMIIPIAFTRAEEGAQIPDVGCSVEASQRYLD